MIKESFTYEEATAYIEEIPKFTQKHTQEHTREFLRRLGDPGMDRKIIHVAGTNGKGSVCAYLQAILMAEGKRTGFFTSPHLVSVNERIQVDHTQIDNETFLRVFLQVLEVVRQMEEEGIAHPSYFEFLLGMGMKAFAGTDVEYIILETGLGGRLDATNSIPQPALSIITSISLDHTAILGDTIEEIAAEKAGIIKRGVPIFYDGSNPKAAEVIRQTARKQGASCREISKNAFEIQEVTRKHIAFSRVNAYDKDVIYQVPICGCYQAMNAEIALEQAAPHLVIDGAHNPGAIEAFVESMKALGADEGEGPVILFSAVSDKKYEQMIAYLCENLNAKAYVITEIEDARKVPAEELGRVFRRYTTKPVICEVDIVDALKAAEKQRGEHGDVYCLGSLYLAGMVKKLLEGGGYHA